MNIILASKSPRRKEILENLNIKFKIITAETDEGSDITDPERLVEELALRKATAVKELLLKENKFTADTVIIGCDTVVSKDSKILGKPRGRAEAAEMIKMLSGETHTVVSGLAIIAGSKTAVNHEVTKVHFDTMTEEETEAYVATGEGDDKAGAYGIQGLACRYIKGIDGCYFNVVGLPVNLMHRMAKNLRITL